ncbi:MAG: hypothetical protein JWQ79_3174 [Mucilaginibacter sp.]|nr:hypothetical protein [Mucilaginibacter sp.]
MVRKKLTTNEWITLLLSSMALIVAIASAYLEHRVENKLEARVVDANVTVGTKPPFDRDTALVSVAYSNTGNRQAILLLPWYQLADTPAIKHGTVNWTFRNEEIFPIQLQPHESRLIKLKIPLSDIMLNPVKPKRSKSMDTVYTTYLRLEYVAMDSNLQADSAFSDFDIELITSKKNIRSIMMRKDPIQPTLVFH